jgi:hypothetical protein
MSAQMIVELPSGAKIHFGQEPVTGLSPSPAVEMAERIGAVSAVDRGKWGRFSCINRLQMCESKNGGSGHGDFALAAKFAIAV